MSGPRNVYLQDLPPEKHLSNVFQWASPGFRHKEQGEKETDQYDACENPKNAMDLDSWYLDDMIKRRSGYEDEQPIKARHCPRGNGPCLHREQL